MSIAWGKLSKDMDAWKAAKREVCEQHGVDASAPTPTELTSKIAMRAAVISKQMKEEDDLERSRR